MLYLNLATSVAILDKVNLTLTNVVFEYILWLLGLEYNAI